MDIAQFQNNIGELFHSLTQGMGSTLRVIIESFGITMVQMRILLALQHHGEQTVGELGEAIGSAPGNTSATCKTLEKKGLITRTRNLDDERIVLISLTEQGIGLLGKINQELSMRCDPILQEFSREDYEQIVLGLTKLKEVIGRLHQAQSGQK